MARSTGRRPALALCALVAAALTAGAAPAAEDPTSSGGKLRLAPARLTSLDELEAAEAKVAEIWMRGPYTARKAFFVERPASVIGDYQPRKSNVFAPGEPLLTYVEPVGYHWQQDGEYFRFGVTIDLELLTKEGKIVGGQKAFQKTGFKTRTRLRELNMNLTLTIDDAVPGDYVAVYTLNDDVSGRSTRVEQPFTIKADVEAPSKAGTEPGR